MPLGYFRPLWAVTTSTLMRKREKRTSTWRGLGNLLSLEIDDRTHDQWRLSKHEVVTRIEKKLKFPDRWLPVAFAETFSELQDSGTSVEEVVDSLHTLVLQRQVLHLVRLHFMQPFSFPPILTSSISFIVAEIRPRGPRSYPFWLPKK